MLSIFETSRFDVLLAEGMSDLFEIILPLAFFLIIGLMKVVANKLTASNEKRQTEETRQRIEARKAHGLPPVNRQQSAEKSWKQVKSTPAEIQEFLEQARQRAEQRKRKRMLRKKGYHSRSEDFSDEMTGVDSVRADKPEPLPSEIFRPEPSPPPVPPVIPISHYEATRQVRDVEEVEDVVVETFEAQAVYVPPEPETKRIKYDYNDGDETHRIVENMRQASPAARRVMFGLDNVDSLKKAVIFSEILGRPKALQQNMGAWEFPC